MKKNSRRGRRPGVSDASEQIREAAKRRFISDGYQGVTLRSVAADVGVDVALVSYYFGSKQGLFVAAMSLSADPTAVLATALNGDPDAIASRALLAVLAMWDDPVTGGVLRTMAATAVSDAGLNRLVSEAITGELVSRVADHLTGTGATQRAAVFCAQVAGLIFSRYLLHAEPIASMPAEEIVRYFAPSLQAALNQPAGVVDLTAPEPAPGP